MNALSPFSTLIAPAAAGRPAAGIGLAAPVETVAAPDGFAGWLPAAAPSATLAGTAVTNVLTNAPISLAANDVAPSAPAAATPPPKPIGGVEAAELRLPMTSIASPATDGRATRGFVPKTMPVAGSGPLEPGTADVQPVMIAALAEARTPATLPEATVDPAVTRDAPAPPTDQPAPAGRQAKIAATPPAQDPIAASPPLPVAAEPVPSEASADPVSSPEPAITSRKERVAKPADEAAAAVPVPLPPGAPIAAAVTQPQAGTEGHDDEAPAREARTRSSSGTTAAPQTQPASAPIAATDRIANTRVLTEADQTHGGTPGSDPKSAGKAVATDPATPDRPTGEVKPAMPAAPSFRAQVDAVQQAAKPAPAQPAPPPVPVAQASHIGHDTAVAIARHVAQDGGETLTIRIAPAELGRIEVRLAFDDGGTLRATVAADQPASLDLLRRDTDTLVRALGDAGVRADSDSLRFDTRSDTGASTGGFASSGQSGNGGQGRRTPFSAGPYATLTAGDEPAAEIRTLSPRGRVDLMA